MFNKQKQRPEDMTDAQMQGRLGVLKGKIGWINKWVPRVTSAMAGIGVAAGITAALGAGVVAFPLVVMSVLVGGAAIGLAASAAVRGGYENQIMDLSMENSDRIERAELAQALDDEKTARLAPSTLELRKEFNAAIEAMDRGASRNLTVGHPLKFRSAGPGFTIEL